MWEITLICVGKLKEAFWASACDEYKKRLGAYARLDIVELPEYRLSQKPSDAEIANALEREGEEILKKVPKGAKVAAMCIEGQTSDSPGFSRRVFDCGVGGTSKLCFIIGGSNGMSPKVKAEADWRLSMSPMTFPHHLARVMLLEQIYRAFQIGTGGSYHK